jgi:hypothetical protein
MVSRFLLHDPSDMGIGGISGKRSSAVGVVPPLPGGVLHPGKPLCRCGPLQRFGPSLQKISQGSQDLCAFGPKTEVKIHHAEKTVLLFDVLRGWAEFDFGDVMGQGGRPCRQNCAAKDFQRRGCKNAFFKIYGKTIGC